MISDVHVNCSDWYSDNVACVYKGSNISICETYLYQNAACMTRE